MKKVETKTCLPFMAERACWQCNDTQLQKGTDVGMGGAWMTVPSRLFNGKIVHYIQPYNGGNLKGLLKKC